MEMSEELKRADYSANRLGRLVDIARHHNQPKVCIPFEEADELAQLLHDSLRSIKEGTEFVYQPRPKKLGMEGIVENG